MRTHLFRLKTQTNFQNVIIFGLNLLTYFSLFSPFHFVSVFICFWNACSFAHANAMHIQLLDGGDDGGYWMKLNRFLHFEFVFPPELEIFCGLTKMSFNEFHKISIAVPAPLMTTRLPLFLSIWYFVLIVKDFVLLIAHCFSLEKR